MPAPKMVTISPGATAPPAKLAAFTTELLTSAGGALVSANRAVALEVIGVAVTLYEPCCEPAVQLACARPERSVMTPKTFVPFEKTHEAPLDGAEKSTRTPGAGRLAESMTRTSRGALNAVVAGALWGVPPRASIRAFGGGSTAPNRMARTRRLLPSPKKRLPSASMATPVACPYA